MQCAKIRGLPVNMRLMRVYVDTPLRANSNLDLPSEPAAHVARVLRARPGDELTLFNGCGGQYGGVIEAIRGSRVAVSVGSYSAFECESPLRSTLVQAIARGERMDFVVQKATELGVSRIVPVLSERTVVRLDARQAESKVAHWRAVARSACEQCGRNRLPQIESPVNLIDYVRSPIAEPLRLWLQPDAPSTSVPGAALAVEVLIGPEGGFAPAEMRAITSAGLIGVRLGPRILRTETAALAAMTWLQMRFGDF